ncbi:acyltransferase domain-containing protein, partial [bacterium]
QSPPRDGEVWTNPEKTLWLGVSVEAPRVGFLFPGQGSQQLLAGRALVRRFAWARELLAQTDAWLAEVSAPALTPLLYPDVDRAARAEDVQAWEAALASTQVAQPAITFVSLLYARFLGKLGITPAVVGGHSLGELTALHAAGAFDDRALIQIAAARGRAMAAPSGQAGKMVSLSCGAEQARALMDGIPGILGVANVNSPRQTVISGEEAAVARLVERAGTAGVSNRMLPVSNAFHSPMMADAGDAMRRLEAIPERLAVRGPRVFSSVDGTELRDGVALREHFGRQTTEQVKFVDLVNALAASCDVILEVGPGRVLSGLVRDTLGAEPIRAMPVAAQAGTTESLHAALAFAFASGADVDWVALSENRLCRPFVPAHARTFIESPTERPFRRADGSIAVAPAAVSGEAPVDPLLQFLNARVPALVAFLRADMERAGVAQAAQPSPPIGDTAFAA